MKTILIKHQKKEFYGQTVLDGEPVMINAIVRHDDECRNGHNTFSITGEIKTKGMYGCLHAKIAKAIPALAPFIKWHLVSTDGPLHYLANTIFHVKNRNLDFARKTAVWPDATDSELLWTEPELTAKLNARLPALMAEFQAAVESLGFVY